MKKLIIAISALLLLNSCSGPAPRVKRCFHVWLVNGLEEDITCTLYPNERVYIEMEHGNYYLCAWAEGNLKTAVVEFEEIKCN